MKKTNTRTLLLSGSLMVAGGTQVVSAQTNQPYNIIYILCDDMGYGDLGCYGQEKIHTPNLDKMAEEGMRFTQHYAGCTVSAPSRGSLMTGKHTGHSQVRGNYEIKPEGQFPMTADTRTIAHLFQDNNYKTGLFGKWGLGFPGSESEPVKMGFDNFYGYNCQRQAHSYYPTHLWRQSEKEVLPGNANNGRSTYSQDLVHQEVLDFIRSNKDQSFFACCTYTLPHAELAGPNDSILAMYKGKFEEVPYRNQWSYTPTEIPYAQFAAMVTRLDTYVGEIMQELKKQGLDKNTLVMFTSDNGPHREGGANPDYFKSYGPLRGTKRDLYEGGIRVPLIAWAPEMVPAGTVSDLPCAFWDMMPTFADMINAPKEKNTDGISFLPTLKGKKQSKKHDYLYWEFHELGGRQAIRQGDWKLIAQNVGDPQKTTFELYNLKNDIHEDNDLSTQYPKIVEKMKKEMAKARTESNTFNFGREKK